MEIVSFFLPDRCGNRRFPFLSVHGNGEGGGRGGGGGAEAWFFPVRVRIRPLSILTV